MEIEKPQNNPSLVGRNNALPLEEVLSLLNSEEHPGSGAVPFRPKAGEVYIFKPGGKINRDDWRADGWR